MNKLVFVVLSFLLLNGCQSTKKSVYVDLPSNFDFPKLVKINQPKSDDINVLMFELGYDGTNIAHTMHQANLNASVNSASYSPALGFTGTLLAGSLLRHNAESSAQKKVNEPVTPFINMLKNLSWELNNTIIPSTELTFFQDDNTREENYLSLTPLISISSDYQTLLIQYLAEIFDKENQTLYRNYINIENVPLITKNETLTNLNNITDTPIYAFIEQSIKTTITLIKKDISIWNKNTYTNKAIRYKNNRGEFYFRGELLEECNEMILLKTLRGEIRQAPCLQL